MSSFLTTANTLAVRSLMQRIVVYRSMMKISIDRPVIPKRGEKEYEPIGGPSTANTASDMQSFALERSRTAMYGALKAERGISSRSVSYGLWFPSTTHAEVTLSRGTMFAGMGYSNTRLKIEDDAKGKSKERSKRTELLPEEALYLIERGSMFCWRVDGLDARTQEDVLSTAMGNFNLEDVAGSPMSVQQAFAEMIGGTGDLTTERYQVSPSCPKPAMQLTL